MSLPQSEDQLRQLAVDEVAEQRAREFRFYLTDLGKAFRKFESALGNAWVTDCREGVSDKRLREVWDASNKARSELVVLLTAAAFRTGE
jgi:hypothetical protein